MKIMILTISDNENKKVLNHKKPMGCLNKEEVIRKMIQAYKKQKLK